MEVDFYFGGSSSFVSHASTNFMQEGIITVALGFMGYIAIIDFPDKATNPGLILKKPFLTMEESAIVLARINRDRGDALVDKLTASKVFFHLRDWKIWEFAWLYFLNVSDIKLKYLKAFLTVCQERGYILFWIFPSNNLARRDGILCRDVPSPFVPTICRCRDCKSLATATLIPC